MYTRFTERAQRTIRLAQEEAKRLNNDVIMPEHLLLGLLCLDDGVAVTIISNIYSHIVRVKLEIEKILPVGDNLLQCGELPLTPKARKVLEYAIAEAQKMGQSYVGSEHILLGLAGDPDAKMGAVLKNFGLVYSAISEEIVNIAGMVTSRSSAPRDKHKNKPATYMLDEFGRDLTQLAKEGKLDPVIGRETEIERLIQILARRTKNNPVLVGESGTGKTAIVEGLAQKIINQEVSENLLNKRLITLDLSGVVAGTKYRGEFEQRLKNIIDEIRNSNANIILFIDELHTVIGAGSAEGAIDASNMLKPSLARGELQCIGATTFAEYRKHIERDSALERRFQPIMVEPPSVEETIKILHGLKEKYETHHKVQYTDKAIVAAVELSDRYITDRHFPDKAIDLLDESGSRAHLKTTFLSPELKDMEAEIENIIAQKEKIISEQKFEKAATLRDKEVKLKQKFSDAKKKWRHSINFTKSIVEEDDIAIVVSKWTGIPSTKLTEKESMRLLKMEEKLHNRVVGQDEAITSISNAIRRTRIGLKDPKKPIGTFIFLGPTGVGKTELAKALAEFMFGHEDSLIRLDMSEYMEKFSVSNLIGSPPGYVGHDEGGQLTKQIRRKPYSVILLDEIEKAHPDVLNILLQIMDTGILTDTLGHKVNFKNTIILMTSNIGARLISKDKSLGFVVQENVQEDFSSMKETVLEELKKTFNPEFINRLDDIIVFHPLGKDDMKKILTILLEKVSKRIKQQGFLINLTDGAKNFLLEKGFDQQYGARPLHRTISKYIEDCLTDEILSKKIQKGTSIEIDYSSAEKKLVFLCVEPKDSAIVR